MVKTIILALNRILGSFFPPLNGILLYSEELKCGSFILYVLIHVLILELCCNFLLTIGLKKMLPIDLLVVRICDKFKICELRGGEEIVYLSTCCNEVGKLLSLGGELFTFNKIITKKRSYLCKVR